MAKANTEATSVLPSVKMLVPADRGSLKDAIESAGATKGSIYLVPIDKLVVAPGFNVRVKTPEYHERIQELKESIADEGFYPDKPLTGYVGLDKSGASVFFVLDGHRRLEATKLAVAEGAEITKLPVVMKDPKAADTDILATLDKANKAEKLTMLDRAFLVKRYVNAGWTDDQIVAKLRVSMQHVRDIHMLLAAPKSVKQAVQAGKVPPSVAVDVIKKANKGGADPTGVAAAKTIEEMIIRAESRGSNKVRGGVDSAEGTTGGKKVEAVTDEETGETKVIVSKPRKIKTSWAVGEGDTLSSRDPNFVAMKKLADDTDWWEADADTGKITITENISFEIIITRPNKGDAAKPAPKAPKAPAVAKAPKEPAAAAAPPPKKPRKAPAAVAPVVVEPDLDDETDEGDVTTFDSIRPDPDLNVSHTEL